MSINLGTLPGRLAVCQGNYQAVVTKKLRDQMKGTNRLLHEYLHPLLYECSSILDPSNEQSEYNLLELLEKFDLNQINTFYRNYRKQIIEKSAEKNVEDGAVHDLFPPDLTEVSPHELRKIEFRIKNWIEACKSFNNRDMQDLYFLVQMGLVLLSCFQNIQREANQANDHIVRNQKG